MGKKNDSRGNRLSNWNSSYFYGRRSIKNSARELGCDIKVETNGAIGVENKLTAKRYRNGRCNNSCL